MKSKGERVIDVACLVALVIAAVLYVGVVGYSVLRTIDVLLGA